MPPAATDGETLTIRIPRSMKARLVKETRARSMSLTRFVTEALEHGLIQSARLRLHMAASGDAIDLTREDD